MDLKGCVGFGCGRMWEVIVDMEYRDHGHCVIQSFHEEDTEKHKTHIMGLVTSMDTPLQRSQESED